MRAIKAIFFGIKKQKEYFIHIQALKRVKISAISQNEKAEGLALRSFCKKAQYIGAFSSVAVAYYIPVPDFFYPIFWRFCACILCYRSITIPIFLKHIDFSLNISKKYDLMSKPELLNPLIILTN
ncbi:unnamed protein product [Blepharisma stoltei]|uniref:Uncharacterized protein n=1 Tax=Blepharisma stoltei TaxID=1481888 RepID=A0AAU9J1N2_9CILI|nr:unnamed protein product [Blepharisma stoltei]